MITALSQRSGVLAVLGPWTNRLGTCLRCRWRWLREVKVSERASARGSKESRERLQGRLQGLWGRQQASACAPRLRSTLLSRRVRLQTEERRTADRGGVNATC